MSIYDKCMDDKKEWYTGAFIGAERTNMTGSFGNHFSGFLYSFHVHQRAFNSQDRDLYRKGSGNGCGYGDTYPCPPTNDGINKWSDGGNSNSNLWKVYYNHWYDEMRICDDSCTTTYSDMGCNN